MYCRRGRAGVHGACHRYDRFKFEKNARQAVLLQRNTNQPYHLNEVPYRLYKQSGLAAAAPSRRKCKLVSSWVYLIKLMRGY